MSTCLNVLPWWAMRTCAAWSIRPPWIPRCARNILRRAGLVRVRKQGREMYYRLKKERIVGTLQGLLDSLTCC